MLKLDHLQHLPELDPLIERLVAEGPGLIVLAGLDPRATLAASSARAAGKVFYPSGRSAIFRILMREILARHPGQAIVVAQEARTLRIPRQLKSRVKVQLVQPDNSSARLIAEAVRRASAELISLLAVDRLDAEVLPAALEAAQAGQRVLAQIDTALAGADVVHHLVDLGALPEQLGSLTWILSVQRMATLCRNCKRPAPPDAGTLETLHRRIPRLASILSQEGRGILQTGVFQAVGCAQCHYSGYRGHVACFDVFRADPKRPALLDQASLLPMGEYVLRLALRGHVPLTDASRFERDQLQRMVHLFAASERALADSNATLQRKVAELEAANRVLQQRTEALISLQDIGQALSAGGDAHESATGLDELAARVCRHACALCGAERAILYFVRPGDKVEILAVNGWDPALVHQQLDAALAFPEAQEEEQGASAGTRPQSFTRLPPGVSGHAPASQEGTYRLSLRAGLRVPLIAQRERVGWMVVHTVLRQAFTPGKVALLETYASQAAVAIQRAGLIEELWSKIEQLEAAQVQLVQKERLERELELARQVQQSLLPRAFPQVTGYAFAAHNEPARQVGGDFYDLFRLDDDYFGLAIADVSDKGMPAAVYMALARSLLLAEARRDRSPRAVLSHVNRLLLELGQSGTGGHSAFVSVFYGIVEAGTRRLVYARAGHDRPLLLRAGTVQSLGGSGAVLGILGQEDLHLSEEQIVLSSGDRLVLYTDGLTDVLAPDDQLYSLERLRALLQSCGAASAKDLCRATFAGLAAYRGVAEQHDDMTMLVVEVK